MGKLTARQCATLGPGKYNDGAGLWLAVSPTGARRWVLRVTVDGKRREMGLGTYGVAPPETSKRAHMARALAAEGIDPIEARHQRETATPTFTQVAAASILAHKRSWSNPKHRRKWVATLKTYARPVIGSKPVDQIGTEDILRISSPIWTNKTETAKRVQGRVENVLDFVAARKWRDPLNSARWRGHLDKLLPRPTRAKEIRRRQPALPYSGLPAFMAELRKLNSASALPLEFLILAAARTSETLKAQPCGGWISYPFRLCAA